ncbi:MAG: hypothetical protein AAF645_04110 [Myxococcota bacterium]
MRRFPLLLVLPFVLLAGCLSRSRVALPTDRVAGSEEAQRAPSAAMLVPVLADSDAPPRTAADTPRPPEEPEVRFSVGHTEVRLVVGAYAEAEANAQAAIEGWHRWFAQGFRFGVDDALALPNGDTLRCRTMWRPRARRSVLRCVRIAGLDRALPAYSQPPAHWRRPPGPVQPPAGRRVRVSASVRRLFREVPRPIQFMIGERLWTFSQIDLTVTGVDVGGVLCTQVSARLGPVVQCRVVGFSKLSHRIESGTSDALLIAHRFFDRDSATGLVLLRVTEGRVAVTETNTIGGSEVYGEGCMDDEGYCTFVTTRLASVEVRDDCVQTQDVGGWYGVHHRVRRHWRDVSMLAERPCQQQRYRVTAAGLMPSSCSVFSEPPGCDSHDAEEAASPPTY